MEISSPDILGDILGLSVDGIAADLSQMSKEEERRLDLVVGEWHIKFLDRLSEVQQESYMAEFCSKFLPSLLRTFLAMEEIHKPLIYFNVFCLAAKFRGTAFFHRFIRSFPDEACTIYLKVLGLLESLSAYLDAAMKADNGPEHVAMLLDLAFYILVGLSRNLPASTTFPSLPLTTEIILRAVANRFDNEPGLRAPLEGKGLWKTFALYSVLDAIEVGDPRKHLSSLRLDKITVAWWLCEAHLAASRTQAECSPCAKLGDGEEMMACSRCLGVRYCSKEHQKADWKRHKKFCFKPTW